MLTWKWNMTYAEVIIGGDTSSWLKNSAFQTLYLDPKNNLNWKIINQKRLQWKQKKTEFWIWLFLVCFWFPRLTHHPLIHTEEGMQKMVAMHSCCNTSLFLHCQHWCISTSASPVHSEALSSNLCGDEPKMFTWGLELNSSKHMTCSHLFQSGLFLR